MDLQTLTTDNSSYLSSFLTPILLVLTIITIFLTITSIIIFHKTPLSSLTAVHLMLFIINSVLTSIRRTSIPQLLWRIFCVNFGLKLAGWVFAKLAGTRTPLPKAMVLGGLVVVSAVVLAIGTPYEGFETKGGMEYHERAYPR